MENGTALGILRLMILDDPDYLEIKFFQGKFYRDIREFFILNISQSNKLIDISPKFDDISLAK
jgi:hypothetical protein